MNRGRLSLNTPGSRPLCKLRLITPFSTRFTCCKPHGSAQRVSAATPSARTMATAMGTRKSWRGEYPAEERPSSSRAAAGRLAKAALLVWAAGTVLAEPLAQAGAYALLLVAALRARRLELGRDVRRFCAVAAALAAWQAISPALAAWSGSAADWPKSGRDGQFFDTPGPALAPPAAARPPLGPPPPGPVLRGARRHPPLALPRLL